MEFLLDTTQSEPSLGFGDRAGVILTKANVTGVIDFNNPFANSFSLVSGYTGTQNDTFDIPPAAPLPTSAALMGLALVPLLISGRRRRITGNT